MTPRSWIEMGDEKRLDDLCDEAAVLACVLVATSCPPGVMREQTGCESLDGRLRAMVPANRYALADALLRLPLGDAKRCYVKDLADLRKAGRCLDWPEEPWSANR